MTTEAKDPRVEVVGELVECFFGTLVKREPDSKDKDGNPVSSVRRPRHADDGWRHGKSHPLSVKVSEPLKKRLADAGFVVVDEAVSAKLLDQFRSAGAKLFVVKGDKATFDAQAKQEDSKALYDALAAAIVAGEVA